MIKNNFKIAWRNIKKHSLYAFVNILGLFAGILFFFLIGSYVWGELQVNHTLKNAGRQYILTSDWKDPNMGVDLATLGPLAKRLKEDYPNLIKNYYRFDGITSIVSKGEKHFREELQLGDSSLLAMYGFPLLHGDINTALNAPFNTVITNNTAIKYFGKTDVIGETLAIRSFSGEIHDFKITGVLNNIPENSVMTLTTLYPSNIFVPTSAYTYFGRNDLDGWGNRYIASFVELQKGAAPADLKQPITQLLQQNTPPDVQKSLTVRPVVLTDYYLEKNNGVIKKLIATLSLVALFILLMAVINFINITISSAGGRMREIGVRKVLGSHRKQLILQFLAESVILVFIATCFAVFAYPLVKPVFAGIVGKNLPLLTAFPLWFLLIPFGLILLVGALAGLYPAFRLSAINMVQAMKGKLQSVGDNVLLRKGLISFQFFIALVVLVAAIIVTQQVSHFFSKSLGYNKEYIVAAQVPRDWSVNGVNKMLAVRDQFAALPQLSNVSLSYEIPNGNNGGQVPVYNTGADSSQAVAFNLLSSDEKYLATYQIPLKAGHFFEGNGRDSGQVIMNEKAIAALGYVAANEAIGKQIRVPGDPTVFTIKGVVSDFHFGSMQQTLSPIMMFNLQFNPNYRFLSFKLKPGNISESIAILQKKWSALLPDASFEYKFLDDSLREMYATEMHLKKAAYAATVLSFIIVLLGIFSLISLSVQQRVKEIGVRKVLGASAVSIISLFVKEFAWLLIIAAIVAIPVSYFIMNGWLSNYAYHINISVIPFAMAVLLLGIIMLIVIGIQTVKAAMANPVKSLRSE